MYLGLGILWLAWVAQAWLSALQVRKFARRFERPRRAAFDRYRPRVAVIVPFKGLEPGLERHIEALFNQDYPDYQLVLVVESEQDPAYPLIGRVASRCPQRRARVLMAGIAPAGTGQKVHNQITAIEHLQREAGGEEVWVFADSDAVPGPNWLGDLVGPLGQASKTAVTTGYRWLIPEAREGESRPSVWSCLASVMNSSVACWCGRDEFNHAWGGSMAVRVATAQEGGLLDLLRGSLTDDYAMTRMARRLGRRVYFVPRCLVASPAAMGLAELVNFAHRQYLITRVCAPGLYAAALGFHALFVSAFVSAWVVLGVELARGAGGWRWIIPAGAIALTAAGHQVRAGFRRRAVRNAFGERGLDRLACALRLDRWATPLWMTLHGLLIVRAGFGRTMCWRGIRYRLDGPQKVQRLADR